MQMPHRHSEPIHHSRPAEPAGTSPVALAGQAMIESLIAIILICLIFFGVMQISQMVAAREILQHAAARGARAKTVGFNQWMVRKAIHVASIPVAGPMLTPHVDPRDPAIIEAIRASRRHGDLVDPWLDIMAGRLVPTAARYRIEHALIPEFMWSANPERAREVLHYEAWEHSRIGYRVSGIPIGGIDPPPPLRVTSWMNYTNWMPMKATYYSGDSVRLEGYNTLENHYLVYIHDEYW